MYGGWYFSNREGKGHKRLKKRSAKIQSAHDHRRVSAAPSCAVNHFSCCLCSRTVALASGFLVGFPSQTFCAVHQPLHEYAALLSP